MQRGRVNSPQLRYCGVSMGVEVETLFFIVKEKREEKKNDKIAPRAGKRQNSAVACDSVAFSARCRHEQAIFPASSDHSPITCQ